LTATYGLHLKTHGYLENVLVATVHFFPTATTWISRIRVIDASNSDIVQPGMDGAKDDISLTRVTSLSVAVNKRVMTKYS